MDTLGNTDLLARHKVGFFAASHVAPLSVLPTLDWAAEVARRDDVAVMCGFRSRLEQQVLDYLLRGSCGVVCVLARGIYRRVPTMLSKAYAADRVLIVSHERKEVVMPSRIACRRANEWIAATADSLVFSSLTPESSLYPLSLLHKPTELL